MAGKKTFKKREPEYPDEDVEEQAPVKKLVIMKPYIDTITKETKPRDINPDKLPDKILVRFKMNGAGETSNRYLGKSGQRYDFNGGVPMTITNKVDIVDFIVSARHNPECWEIVG